MLRTNRDRVVKWSVQGKVHHPTGGGYRITHGRNSDGFTGYWGDFL